VSTLDYGARPEGEAAVELPPEPETVVRRRAGRETLDEIARALSPETAPGPEDVEISELVTFVVRGSDLASLSTEDGRRQFAQDRLLKRLPVASMRDVLRVDVTPWTVQGTLIVRVWCRLED
jgi:hypothetical protein